MKMKNLGLVLCLLFCVAACDSDSPLPDPDGPNIRVDVQLTEQEKILVASGNTFAYDLYAKVREDKESPNAVLSPLSVSLAFSMLNNGAAGETREEIQKVLGFEGFDAADINGYYKKMIEAAATIDRQVTFESANSIWTHNGFPILPGFVSVNREAYDAEIRNEDFSLPATLNVINNWASEKTHGKIPKILDRIDPDTRLILMNALYFLGEWKDRFEKGNTADAFFFNANGQASTVKMMKKTEETVYWENDKFASIDLPYGNGAFYMQLVLPHEGISLEETVPSLGRSLERSTSDLEGVDADVSVQLPKFEIDFKVDLNDILIALEMETPFDPYKANFSSLSNVPLFVSFVKQRAAITVDEKGTEAAAVTAIGMRVTSVGPGQRVPRDFHVKRPFIFLIREVSTNAIFFMGEVTAL